jgi:hypothetical protein
MKAYHMGMDVYSDSEFNPDVHVIRLETPLTGEKQGNFAVK